MLQLHAPSFDPADPDSLGEEPVRGESVIYLVDEATLPGALGFHDLNSRDFPIGFVFVLDVGDWTVTFSHEVLEMVLDPTVNIFVPGPDPRNPANVVLHTYEICDAVESHSYRIKVRKRFVGVSNFLYSTWFDLENPPNTKFDHMHVTTKPFELAPGGSAVTWDGFEVKIKTRKLPKTRKQRKSHKLARTHQRCMQM